MSWVIMNWQKLSMTILHGGWTSVGTTTTMLESESILHREPIFHPMRMSPIDIPCLCTISKLGNGMTIYGKLITPQHPDYLRALTQSRGTCTMGQFVDMPLYTNTACAFTVSIWEEGKSVWRIPKNRQLTPHILLWTRHLYSPRQIVPFGQYWTYTNWPDYTVVSVIIPMERLQAWLQVIDTLLAGLSLSADGDQASQRPGTPQVFPNSRDQLTNSLNTKVCIPFLFRVVLPNDKPQMPLLVYGRIPLLENWASTRPHHLKISSKRVKLTRWTVEIVLILPVCVWNTHCL